MTPPLVIPPYLKEAPLTGLIGMGGGATSRRFYTASDEGYQIEKSIRFNRGSASQLVNIPTKSGNTFTWTWAAWIKRGATLATEQDLWGCLDPDNTGSRTVLRFQNDDTLFYGTYSSSAWQHESVTTAVFRDTSAWMHVCLAVDNAHNTASERTKLYINGKRVTMSNDPAQNLDTYATFEDTDRRIGSYGTATNYFDGLMADIHFYDGVQLSPAAFGSVDSINIFNPKETISSGALLLPAPNKGTDSVATGTLSGTGGTFDYAFDGIIDVNRRWMPDASADQWIQCNWATAINVTATLRIYAYAPRASSILSYYTVNGGSEIEFGGAGASADWYEIPFTGELSTLRIRTTRTGGSTTSPELWGVEVDGVVLKNNTTDVETKINRNKGETAWSTMLTVDTGAITDAAKGFNGKISDWAGGDASEAIITFTPVGGIAFTNSVKVWLRTASHQARINGGSWVASTGNPTIGDWVTVATGSGTITTLDMQYTAASLTAFNAIMVDGCILIDNTTDNSFKLKGNDVSVNRRLGRNILDTGIDSATGGLPIYSTTAGSDGYDNGEQKGAGFRADSSAGTTSGTGLVFAMPGDTLRDIHASINTGSTNKAVTVSGDAAVSTSLSRFYGSSLTFDATGDHIATSSSSSDFTMGTGDFTVECWASKLAASHKGIWQISATAGGFQTSNYGDTLAVGYQSGVWQIYGAGNAPSSSAYALGKSQWYHLAYVRSSGTSKLYVNGVEVISASDTMDYDGTYLVLGGYYNSSYLHNGNIQDFRVYKGVAKYTSAFTVGTRNDFEVNNINASTTSTRVYGSTFLSDGAVAKFYDDDGVDDDGIQSRYNMFDGSTTTRCGNPDSTNVFSWDTTGYGFRGQLRIYGANTSGSNDIYVNDVDSGVDLTGSAGWITVGTYNDGINKIHFSAAGGIDLRAFEIDGVVITDTKTGNPVVSEVDSLVDSPTAYGTEAQAGGEVRGNYCTFNPLDTKVAGFLSEGNLKFINSGSNWRGVRGSFVIPDGKWYWEFTQKDSDGTSYGIGSAATNLLDHFGGGSGTQEAYTWGGANYYVNGSGTGTSLSAPADGDVIGVAYDRTNGKIHFSRNGQWYGASWATKTISEVAAGTDPVTSSISTTMDYYIGHSNYGAGNGCILNTGQLPFVHSAPSGFNCLVSGNLSDIFGASDNALGDKNNPSKYFNALAYVGNDSSDRDVLGVGFQPEFVWIKNRDATAWHMMQDAVRGANKVIYSHETNAEYTDNENGHVNSFIADGFNVDAGSAGNVNELNENYVAWCWDAGTSANSSANTDGTDITVAIGNQWVNQTAGFSVTKFTGSGSGAANSDSGDSVGHGLSAAPDYIMIKKLTSANGWPVWHSSFNALEVLALQSSNSVDSSNYCYPSVPTATAVPLGNNPEINDNADDFIMYAWNATPGFSAFGQYIGNAGSAGAFCYCGFKPKYVLLKGQSFAGNFNVFDSARNPTNPANGRLFPNSSGAQVDDSSSGNRVNMLANGFEIAGSNADTNNNTSTFVWCAFAEHPFKVSRAG